MHSRDFQQSNCDKAFLYARRASGNLNTLTTNPLHEPIQQTAHHSEPKLKFHSVTDYEIHRKLAIIKLNKATGQIPIKILRIAAKSISQSPAKIVNSSLNCEIFPNKWKIAKVSPIFKGNNSSERDNYRPISVLSTIARHCGQTDERL